ncbi:MAG: cell wall-binding repeat-containing protein [Peptostreptococcus stomatis]|uniref:cell wall-binding repeat-containing protein n=1 Tax=Peptostreptococcus stomatis TaxID=341694 RepID=UPI001A40261B|nr:cell wall-binding repeat-containing protein [Peptostreptococcus stomatis]MBL6464961.1 cell wall-binding repeat-containing protein [Peptostreptococcus stomatis]
MKVKKKLVITMALLMSLSMVSNANYALENNFSHQAEEVLKSDVDLQDVSRKELVKERNENSDLRISENTDLFTVENPDTFIGLPISIFSKTKSITKDSVIEYQREDGSIVSFKASNEDTEISKNGEYHFNIIPDTRGIWKVYSIDGKRIQNDKLTFMTYTDGQDFDKINNEEYRKNESKRLLRAPSRKNIIRYEGSDRVNTAVTISNKNFNSARNVIVTNAWKPSDALAATALAKSLNSPILYVNKDELPSNTKYEIDRLGAENIYVVGGENSVSENVKSQLYYDIRSVRNTYRISGENRAGTALELAKEAARYKKGSKAFIVTGTSDSDCLAVSAASGENSYFMFYVVNGNLDWESRNYIRNNFNSVFIANGNENINSSIVNDLRNSGLRVNQIYGDDSFDLSMKISENSNEFYTTLHSVYLTSGRNVADGVPGSVLAAKSGMPLMLVDGNNNKNEIASYINKKNVDRVYILGGRNSVPTEVENAINNTGGGTNPISNKREAIVNLAMKQLGKKYVYGAMGPNTFDCSGLVYYVYKNAINVTVPRTAKSQGYWGTSISKSNLKPGDILYWNSPYDHVAIYIGDNKIIHAPEPGKNVTIVNIYKNPTSCRRFIND